MLTNILYRDIKKTEALEDFLVEQAENAIRDFLKNDDQAHMTMRLETVRHRTDRRKPIFHCELILKPTHTKSVIKVDKKGDDFYTCIAKAMRALEEQLRRRADKFANHGKEARKKQKRVERVPDTETAA